jgi:2-dehydro-3-deoxygalactonokinase
MIAVDWGTSTLRCYRVGPDGAVLDQRRSGEGTMVVRERHAATLAARIEGWDDGDILLCGPVGGRSGWIEMPYLPCPVDVAGLAGGLRPLQAGELPGRRLWFVPGAVHRNGHRAGEVMRGEETQAIALADRLGAGTHVACLPGTHSKWVRIEDGRIASIHTAMTGELFDLLRRHGTLAPLMPRGACGHDEDAFARGFADSDAPGGLLHHLFGVRAQALFDTLAEPARPAYLSGLLIGHEVRALRPMSGLAGGAPVHLAGNPGLLRAYGQAFALLGIACEPHPESITAAGLHAVARQRGLA